MILGGKYPIKLKFPGNILYNKGQNTALLIIYSFYLLAHKEYDTGVRKPG